MAVSITAPPPPPPPPQTGQTPQQLHGPLGGRAGPARVRRRCAAGQQRAIRDQTGFFSMVCASVRQQHARAAPLRTRGKVDAESDPPARRGRCAGDLRRRCCWSQRRRTRRSNTLRLGDQAARRDKRVHCWLASEADRIARPFRQAHWLSAPAAVVKPYQTAALGHRRCDQHVPPSGS